jgi:hypothetical protein
MPALQYWFSGLALGAFITLVAGVSTLGFAWYRAALDNETASIEKQTRVGTEEIKRRARIVDALRAEYIASHDGLSAGLLAGTELPPSEWLNSRLGQLGETWKVP